MNSKPLPGIIVFAPVAVAAFLYLVALSATDLWTPDEPRYAQVAREMIESGDYIHLQVNGQPYTEKPPLFFWLVAGAARIAGGVDQYAVRLPSVLAALGTITLLIAFVRRRLGGRGALLAGMILCASPQFFWLARSGHIDMLLAFLVTAGLLAFYRWHETRRPVHLLVLYGCLGLAALAKGPVGMLLPALAIVAFLAMTRQLALIRRMHPLIGLAAATAVALAWYVPAMSGSTQLEPGSVVLRQILGRLFHPDSHGVSIWYWPFYQVIALAWGLLPWSLLLPWAGAWAWRRRDAKPQALFLLCWAGSILAFFTLIASKREIYILPMYAAAAGLVAAWLEQAAAESTWKPLRGATFVYGGALAAIAAAAVVIGPGYFRREFPDAVNGFDHALVAAWFGMVAVLVVLTLLARHKDTVIAASAAASVFTLTFVAAGVLPWVDTYKSPRGICSLIVQLKEPASRIAMWGRPREEYIFYTRTRLGSVRTPEELRRFFDTDTRMFCLIQEREYNTLGELPLRVFVVTKQRVSSRVMLLLCNQEILLCNQETPPDGRRRSPPGPR